MSTSAATPARSKHFDDLRRPDPTKHELLEAAAWAQTHDPSEGFRQELRGALRDLGPAMATVSELREHIAESLWSQWHELGVSSTVPRRRSDDVIDPEPLVAFTAVHGDLDARLRDESIDWTLSYGKYLSKARLKNVLADWGVEDDAHFREYAATVNAHSNLAWPAGGGTTLAFQPRSRALLEDLSRPALLSLRIRAVFGVGARAEILRALVRRPEVSLTAADLAAETSYGKRNVLNELKPLRLAGIVKSIRVLNADRFSLAKAAELVGLVGPTPARATRWTETFRALHLMLDLATRTTRSSDLAKAVEASRFVADKRDILAAAEMYPPPLPVGTAAWRSFLEWAVGYARSIARI